MNGLQRVIIAFGTALAIASQVAGSDAEVRALKAWNDASASRSPRPAQLQIQNGGAHRVDVYWQPDDDDRVFQDAIEPGSEKIISTVVGHRFIVVDTADQSVSDVICRVPHQSYRVGGVPGFYAQSASAHGLPVVASARVNPYAIREAVYLVDLMLGQRPDVRQAMIDSGSRLCVMAYDEYTTDLPEWAWLAEAPEPEAVGVSIRDFRDARSRGMGGSETDPYCSCGEENLLGYPGDPYSTENILIHELAHNIHLRGMNNLDDTFDMRLRQAYQAAMQEGLWRGKYASVNHHEYFAEGVQSWFDDNRENDHDHNHVNTRAELIEYDPRLASLCQEVFGATELRYTKPATRTTGHLEGYDPATAPRFEFPQRLREAMRVIQENATRRAAP